jgi:hypothetical protein
MGTGFLPRAVRVVAQPAPAAVRAHPSPHAEVARGRSGGTGTAPRDAGRAGKLKSWGEFAVVAAAVACFVAASVLV